MTPTQTAFDWDAPVPDPPKRTLDADGHRRWAELCRYKQQETLVKGANDPENAEEYMSISADWKRMANEHERRAEELEGKS